MKLSFLAVFALAACGAPVQVASAPAPVQTAVPAPVPEPLVVVPPAGPAAPSTQPPVHVRVAIPVSTGYVIAADQRFVKDVVKDQPYMVNAVCNPDQPYPYYRTYITKGDGLYLDFMSCKKVGQDVVDEWFYAWNKIAKANPSYTPKQIQDAISAGAY